MCDTCGCTVTPANAHLVQAHGKLERTADGKASVEVLASETWPEALHAAVAIPDVRKGEQVVLLTTVENADRSTLSAIAQQKGIAEISVPRRILPVNKIPVLGTGKIDYVAAGQMVEAMA